MLGLVSTISTRVLGACRAAADISDPARAAKATPDARMAEMMMVGRRMRMAPPYTAQVTGLAAKSRRPVSSLYYYRVFPRHKLFHTVNAGLKVVASRFMKDSRFLAARRIEDWRVASAYAIFIA